jgi:phospholipid/cholesterol/gamma-HCH transport system ATP-binding protein
MITSTSVVFDDVSFSFDDKAVLRHVSFELATGRMRFLLGESGSGKSVLLKLALGLFRPDAGKVFVGGQRIDHMDERDLLEVRTGIGMVFQDNALFDSLTVAENVGYRLYESTDMPLDQVRARVAEVLASVGLAEFIDRMPAQLSGGERRRVALARAMASRPALLLLDDPTTGLDPLTAMSVDDEIVKLRDLSHVTSMIATQQIRDAFYIATHSAIESAQGVRVINAPTEKLSRIDFMVLQDGGILFEGSASELLASKQPYMRKFLSHTLPPW